MRKIIMFPLTAMIGLLMTIGLLTATSGAAQAAVYRMQISEIWYNSPGQDPGGHEPQPRVGPAAQHLRRASP